MCLISYIIGIGDGHGESKVEKDNVSEERVQRELARFAEPKKRLVEDKILTMKSLILAQDER